MQGVNIFYLLLGWLLGILSPLIIDRVKRHHQKEEFKKGLLVELEDVRYRLAGAVYLISSRFGRYNRDLLNWMHKISTDYNDQKRLEAIEKLMKLSDKEIDALARTISYQHQQRELAFGLKKYSLPFLDSNLRSVSLLDIKLQRLVIEIRARLNLINEEIDLNRFYFEKTFDSTLSEENYKIITKNLDENYRNISNQFRIAVDKLTYLTDKLS